MTKEELLAELTKLLLTETEKKLLRGLIEATDSPVSSEAVTVEADVDSTLIGGDLQSVLIDLAGRIDDLENPA